MFLKKLSSSYNSLKLFILFYIIFMITTALFCFLNIHKLNSVSGIQENQYLQENLKNTRYSIEAELGHVKSVIDQLSNTRCVEELIALSDSTSNKLNEQDYAVYNAVLELRNIKSSSNPIEHLGVFIKESNIVADNIGAYNAFDYFKNIFIPEGIDISRWYGLTDGFQNFHIMPSGKVTLNSQTFPGFTFIKTIPPNDINSKGVIFAVFKKDYLDSLIQSMNFDVHTSGVIVDDNNKIIAASKNFKDIPLPAYSKLELQEIIPSEDKTCSFMPIQIKNLPWKLILVKNNSFSNKFSYAGINIILALSAIFIIGVFVSILLQKYYSRTLNAITGSIGLHPNDEQYTAPSDLNRKKVYAVFEHKFKALLNEINRRNEAVSHYKNIIRSNALLSVLRPSGLPEEHSLINSVQNEIFIDSQAFVICFYTNGTVNNDTGSKCYIDLAGFIQKNSLQFHSLEYQDSFKVFLVFLDNKQLKLYEEVHSSTLAYKKELEIEYDAAIHMEIGSLCTSMDALAYSYKSISMKLKAQKYTCAGYPTKYPDIPKEHNIMEFLPISKESLIIRHLKSGSADEAEAVVRDLLKTCFNDNTPISLFESKVLFHELLALTIRYIEDEKGKLNLSYPDYTSIKTFDDIILLMKQLCLIRKSYESRENKAARSTDLKSDILIFINDNYLDHNLSLKLIKDEFDVSLSLVTKAVKELTGNNFLDYLNKKRIKYAKKLLHSPEVTISKARELSGFNDDSVFIKVFKKYEGKTPGEYKKSLNK